MQGETDEMNPSSAPYSLSQPSAVTKGALREQAGAKLSGTWDCGINRKDLTLKLSSTCVPER